VYLHFDEKYDKTNINKYIDIKNKNKYINLRYIFISSSKIPDDIEILYYK